MSKLDDEIIEAYKVIIESQRQTIESLLSVNQSQIRLILQLQDIQNKPKLWDRVDPNIQLTKNGKPL